MTLELISLIALVGSPEVNPLTVKLLDNRLYVSLIHHVKLFSDYHLKYRTICQQDTNLPFEYQTSTVFGWLLYLDGSVLLFFSCMITYLMIKMI